MLKITILEANNLKPISILKSNIQDYLTQKFLSFKLNKKLFGTTYKLDQKNISENKTKHWTSSTEILVNNIKDYGLNFFLRFNIIKGTMFLHDEKLSESILSENIIKRYRLILSENTFGHPILSKKYEFTSINKLHQFHHLLFLKKNLNYNLKDKNVLEIGGGYGLLSSIIFEFIKPKKIIIFDLKIFNFIQKIYLQNILKKNIMNKIKFFHNLNLTRSFFNNNKPNITFAMWSLSEMPINLREQLIPIIFKSDTILIGYQSKFENINNFAYFKNIQRKKLNYEFKNVKVPYLKNNYYLLCKKKHEKK